MSNIICLATHRKRRRQNFLVQHGRRLDQYIEWFVCSHININFRQITIAYQMVQMEHAQQAWDYIDFREILRESIEEAFGPALVSALHRQPWFDRRLVSDDEILDRCLSIYILGSCRSALNR